MANEDVAGVQVYKRLVDSLLDRAAQVKPDKQIEPPMTETHLGESIWQMPSEDDKATKHLSAQTKLAAVEIAFREKFYRVLVRLVQSSSPQGIVNIRHRPRLPSMTLLSFKSGTSSTSSPSFLIMVSFPTPSAVHTVLTTIRTMRTRPYFLAH